MMISNLQINSLLKIYNKEGGRSSNLGKGQVKNGTLNSRAMDQTQVSEEAKNFQVAMKATRSAPEVRESTVTELREAIRTGNYSVKGEDIAEKMLARALVDKLV